MIRILLIVSAACACVTDLHAADRPRTMRVDYFHSGNRDLELFSLDQVVLEPLPWPGNLAQPIDSTFRGKYAFSVIDPDSGDIAWSRSFSSIYGEWETTGEAREINRTFHESLRFPAQSRPFDVVISKRGDENEFAEIWRARIDPKDYLVHEESAAHAKYVVVIEQNGDPASKVDLLILGDGYTRDEQEEFIARAREMTEILFAASPFRERRSDFNVWALAPPAAQSGVSRPSTGIYRDTPLGTSYDAFRSERYVLTYDNQSFRRIASSVPYDFVEILVNSETYGGGGIYGLYGTTAADSEWGAYVFVHEFGHHFAGLADEYYTSSVAYEAPEHIEEPYEPNVTALLDPAGLKWRRLVGEQTPLPTPWPKEAFEEHSLAYQAKRTKMREENVPESEMNALFQENQDFVEDLFSTAEYRNEIGAFEGGNYQAKGLYRSALNCIMFTRTRDFCAVCSAAIEDVIDEYTKPAD
ncbi:MAG: M64 family metallopeptidase [Woeseia sp.]